VPNFRVQAQHLDLAAGVEAHFPLPPEGLPRHVGAASAGVVHVAGAEEGRVLRPFCAVNGPLRVHPDAVVRLHHAARAGFGRGKVVVCVSLDVVLAILCESQAPSGTGETSFAAWGLLYTREHADTLQRASQNLPGVICGVPDNLRELTMPEG